MNSESKKSNAVLIIIAIIGVVGTITASLIGVIGNYNTEKFRQEAELTRIALISIATQGGATQIVLQSTIDAPTETSLNTPTEVPTSIPTATKTPVPSSTATPIGFVTEVHRISGENTSVYYSHEDWYSTGIFIKEGDTVNIEYISGEWWIGERNSDNKFSPQTPTDANGYRDRDEERVIAQMDADDPNSCKQLVSAPIGGLIGRINEQGGIFFVGNQLEFTANEDGILLLRMNYNNRVGTTSSPFPGVCPGSNGGGISVRITILPNQ